MNKIHEARIYIFFKGHPLEKMKLKFLNERPLTWTGELGDGLALFESEDFCFLTTFAYIASNGDGGFGSGSFDIEPSANGDGGSGNGELASLFSFLNEPGLVSFDLGRTDNRIE